jgi:integrase
MKLIELPKSPYWGANIHVGYYPDGTKRYSPKSSKVRRDPSLTNEHGGREDKIQALKVLTALQDIANQAMEVRKERESLSVAEYDEMLSQLLRSVGIKRAASGPSWDKFAAAVLDRHCRDLAPSSARSYLAKKSGFDKWLEKHDRLSRESSLADFRLPDIQAFYDWWISEGGQTTTANGALQGISLVFEQAVIEDLIPKNPCIGVKRRDNVMVPRQPFTLADLSAISRALMEHSDAIEHAEEWGRAIRFAIFTGARESDCVSLRWADFSDDFRTVRFIPQKKERLHRLRKVDASVSLMLPEFVAAEFRAAREGSASEWVTPSLRTITAGKRGLGPRFREILDFAGVVYVTQAPKGNKGIAQCSHSFHSFRHTIKTQMRAAGVSTETSNYVTGHDDAKVAARYVHEKSETIFRECAPVFADFEAALREPAAVRFR